MNKRKISRSRILVVAFLVGQCVHDKSNFVVEGIFTRKESHSSGPHRHIPQESGPQDQFQAQPPLPPIEDAARSVVPPRPSGAFSRPRGRDQSSVQALIAKARSTSEQFAARKSSDVAYYFNVVNSRIRERQGKKALDAATEKDLITTTRLSGGAESAVDTSSKSQQDGDAPPAESSSQSATPKSRQAFLGNLGLKKPRLPKAAFESLDLRKRMNDGYHIVQQTGSRVGPSFATMVSLLWQSEKGMSFASLYAFALLGSSCGFHLFLYFITVGYALGVTLPATAALYVYNKHKELSRPTIFHSTMTIVWGVRLLLFLLWREYVSWPALHKKVIELQSRMSIPFASSLLCWGAYSFFYVAMVSMSWSRLAQSTSRWGILGYLGLLIQVTGLVLESIADSQKNGFKSQHRHSWCNIGVWGWSTHPNYLGEGMFWWGSYLAHGFHSILHSLMATIGLLFITVILKGSTRSLSHKQLEKYGDQPAFCEFHRTHSIWGPKRWWWWLQGLEELSKPKTVAVPTTELPVSEESTNGDLATNEEAPQPAQPVS